ncbi:MAG: membrane protein insertase YidC [Gammaproteobacteria bacterium]
MANLRPALLITLVFLAYLMWVEWQRDYGPAPEAAPTAAADLANEPAPPTMEDIPKLAQAPVPEGGDLPAAPAVGGPQDDAESARAQDRRSLIRVTTDLVEAAIDPAGATLVSLRLRNYPVNLEQPDIKVRLLSPEASDLHVAQSGLLSRQPAPNHTTQYSAPAQSFELADGQDSLVVPLTWRDPSGVEVTKSYRFERGRYLVGVEHAVRNGSPESWSGARYEQLQRVVPVDEDSSGFNNPERYSFRGVGFYSAEEKLEKIDLEDVADEPYERTTTDGWLAMIQHYFLVAWIPAPGEANNYSTQVFAPDGRPRAIARAVSQPVTVPAGGEHRFTSSLYVGPKLHEQLAGVAPGLELTVNYGIFTVLSAPLFWLLDKIHEIVGNWGWAIVILTVLIKLGFFKLTEAQFRSMARMRKLQPRIEKLKERYGDDRQAMSQAMMQMYKEEKVNPLGGCLPVLVQIPIFIALYWVLIESVELRQAPFILWIDNLSVRDPYFILPALNAAFMIATQKLTPMVGMDPLQRKMMQAMPVVFSVMFAFFPAGLVLYWATNAGLSLAQQWYITRKIEREA